MFTKLHRTLNKYIYLIKKTLKKFLPENISGYYYLLFPFIGHIVFGFPARKIRLLAVTGTDGKSSVVILVSRILQEAGYKIGFSSSILFNDGNNEYLNDKKLTMPGRFFMQRFLKKLVENQCQYGVIEVTSEGIKQQRHRYIDFDFIVLTNITAEHIESHGGFKNYRNTKAKLFQNLYVSFPKDIAKTIIVNADYKESLEFLKYKSQKKLKFAIHENSADIKAIPIQDDLSKTKFTISDK